MGKLIETVKKFHAIYWDKDRRAARPTKRSRKASEPEVGISFCCTGKATSEANKMIEALSMMDIAQQITFLVELEALRKKAAWRPLGHEDRKAWERDLKEGRAEWDELTGKEPLLKRTAFTLTGDKCRLDCWVTIPLHIGHNEIRGNGGFGGWFSVWSEPKVIQRFIDALVSSELMMLTTPNGATYWLP